MKKCVMIFNAKSGKNKTEDLINDIKNVIKKYDYEIEIIFTKRKGHAIKIVEHLDDDIDLVISAGGDGTFHEVINGNLKRKNKLLVSNLPLGTTNDVGKMYGLDGSIFENLENLLTGTIKNIDVCIANNSPFIYFLGFGNFVDISYTTSKRLKEKYGHLAYIIHALRELKGRIRLYDVKYKVNGQIHEGKYSFIFITNSNHVAGIENIYDDIKLDDKKFEVVFFDIKSKLNLIKNICLLKFKRIEELPNSKYYKTDNLSIEIFNNDNISWCSDGEELKIKENKIDIHVNSEINVLLPKKNINKLFVNK